MNLETLYVEEENKLASTITKWAEEKRIQVAPRPLKNSELLKSVDGVVLFHENHNFSREDEEIVDLLNKNNKSAHKVDINGTLSATNSNFNMWLERNKPLSLLILGESVIGENGNLTKFLEGIEY